MAELQSPISRQRIVLKNQETAQSDVEPLINNLQVLVINSSHSMAKEITHELAISLPGCSIMYAPSIELAALILKRRNIDLIISSSILPDGSISKLLPVLKQYDPQPNLVVFGHIDPRLEKDLNFARYKKNSLKKLVGKEDNTSKIAYHPARKITLKKLGADIRNDLNNPLQEIVTMVFVAQNAPDSALNPATNTALLAIQNAADNMSKVVKDLEDKIRKAVG